MATLTIRNLPDEVRDKLRVRAAENGRSMEAEARQALVQAYTPGEAWRPATAADRAALARSMLVPYLQPDRSLVEELLAERRAAAARGE